MADLPLTPEEDAFGLEDAVLAVRWRRIADKVDPSSVPAPADTSWLALATLWKGLEESPASLDPRWALLLPAIRAHAIQLPYLGFGPNQFIYRFRTDRQRNRAIYQDDAASRTLYQSQLCAAIKAARRLKENRSGEPETLSFGAVEYVLPSHFGFCLGVQNAIERAYEVIAAHPDRRVFMLSELIHNPFVNSDLLRRGLRYLQTDKGKAIIDPATGKPFWESLSERDVVIIPAFGATNEDKVRLIEKGLPLNEFDATCMLVEKVWKAARRFSTEGFTVIIHGKAEHEETKATFSNTARFGPGLIVRDLKEAEALADLIREPDPERLRAGFAEAFAGKSTEGFDPVTDLTRLAVVNQTTLLRNETLRIIERLEAALVERFGAAELEEHMHPQSRGDTLCYATQVNQDALTRALSQPLDLALVAGGTNSSNTYQLYRVCKERIGDRAAYIQSEENIVGPGEIRHFHFAQNPQDPMAGSFEMRKVRLPGDRPMRILITGGASCPDGIIQQIITRCNQFFAPETLRPIEEVLEEVRSRVEAMEQGA
jgi:4-hydroxy-3-methylbut-2-enyl diphosphate reductase